MTPDRACPTPHQLGPWNLMSSARLYRQRPRSEATSSWTAEQ